MKQLIVNSFAAGIAISISCIAFLATGNAWTFPIGLFIICFLELYLFTGRVPFATLQLSQIYTLIIMLIINLLAASLMGILTHYMYPNLATKSIEIVNNKLNEGWYVIPRAILCNIMIFVAVYSWKKLPSPNNIIGLIFATAIFVFCGFEHCVANAFYFGCAMQLQGAFWFITLNTIGNAIGGILAYHTITCKGE